MIERIDLIKILKDNTKWPIVIEGVSSTDFPTSTIIPATISSSELGIIPSEEGFKLPNWLNGIIAEAKQGKTVIICIDKLDEIPVEEQEKFYGMIKYRGINGLKFPERTQIVITAKNVGNISKKILSLAVCCKVG